MGVEGWGGGNLRLYVYFLYMLQNNEIYLESLITRTNTTFTSLTWYL